jgi:hypothetical protein
MSLNGSSLCLVRDEVSSVGGRGERRSQAWEGTEAELLAKASELQLSGWAVRLGFDSGQGRLEAESPEVSEDGETIQGATDEWDFTTEFIDVDYWASPLLYEIAKGILPPGAPHAIIRDYLSVIRRTINQQLQFAYDATGNVLLEADGSKSMGPTAYENFKAKGKDGSIITDAATQLFAKDAYEWAQAGVKTVQTSLVAINRRRSVPAESTLRFHADKFQRVWTRAKFIVDFSVPAHIQTLLPTDPTELPFVASKWGYKLRLHEARAEAATVVVNETTGFIYGAWNTQTHLIVDVPTPPTP